MENKYIVTFTLKSGAEFRVVSLGDVKSTKEEYAFNEPDGSARFIRKENVIGYHINLVIDPPVAPEEPIDEGTTDNDPVDQG